MSTLPGLKHVPQLGTQQVRDALIRWLTKEHPDRYALIAECPNVPGFQANRYIDLLTVETWPSRGFERVAYEVKVSRADFLKEIKQHSKTDTMLQMAHRAYFVCPAGLITKDEVPLGCGLIHVSGADRAPVKVIVKAPRSEVTSELTPGQWVGLLSAMNKRGPATRAVIKFGTEELDAAQMQNQLDKSYSRGYTDGKASALRSFELYGEPSKLSARVKELEGAIRKCLGKQFFEKLDQADLDTIAGLHARTGTDADRRRNQIVKSLRAALEELEAAS